MLLHLLTETKMFQVQHENYDTWVGRDKSMVERGDEGSRCLAQVETPELTVLRSQLELVETLVELLPRLYPNYA